MGLRRNGPKERDKFARLILWYVRREREGEGESALVIHANTKFPWNFSNSGKSTLTGYKRSFHMVKARTDIFRLVVPILHSRFPFVNREPRSTLKGTLKSIVYVEARPIRRIHGIEAKQTRTRDTVDSFLVFTSRYLPEVSSYSLSMTRRSLCRGSMEIR